MTSSLAARIKPPAHWQKEQGTGSFWGEFEQLNAIPSAQALIDLITARSSFLGDLIAKNPAEVLRFLQSSPEEMLRELCQSCSRVAKTIDKDEARQLLRVARSRVALLIAIADLGQVWTVDEVTAALTTFAEAATQAALNCVLQQAAATGKITLRDATNPSAGSGYVVLGMGKLGACELNYSSDIDLIVLFDAETAPLASDVEPSTFFVRLTRNLVSLLQDMTEDGYVFRVDLRLRPDPRATQIAISMEAAAVYYEYQGQNWERAAMIKARPIAGDLALGEEFLARLAPYIWRRYLDFAAIADVQSMKRQIHAVKGHGEIATLGHNLKLGRGGIREIEFFVQTQQLIAGGRNAKLRGKQTLAMLAALAEEGWISPVARDELTAAYRFLRTLEHRIQMQRDEQDHCLPASDPALESLAPFAGFESATKLKAVLQETLQTVQRHYQALFETAEELSSTAGNLVFTGGDDDPGTIETLQRMGYRDASEVSATIRAWHFGRYPAMRAAKSRELLTELMPQLLKALADTGDADQAFVAFDAFLRGLPAGVQLFSMLKANLHLLDLIVRILGTAPRLATQLSRQPRVLEAVLERGFFGSFPTLNELSTNAATVIPPDLPLEEAMNRARVLGREQMFRVGVRVLSDTVSAAEAGEAYANVADTLLQTMHRAVTHDMAVRHGVIAGGTSAIIALGKLGGREMTASSDLDLILVYDAGDGAEVSDGERPLSAQQYFSRLTQRLITSITAPTSEGILYEVDMRLRPSGSKGPVAVSLASFVEYQRDSAWTWEKLALTRARVASADPVLRGKLESDIRNALCAARERATVLEDARSMRALMLREQKTSGRWDIKRKRGGLVDIEFLAQSLQLVSASQHPAVLQTNTRDALRELGKAGVLSREATGRLLEAHKTYSALVQVLRLCLDGDYQPETSPRGLHQAICRAASLPDVASVEALLDELATVVAVEFENKIGKTTT